MKQIAKYVLPFAAALVVAGCGLSHVSKEGTTEHPVWPEIQKAGVNFSGSQHGTWPNWDNVRQIEAGMNKQQLYYLIGKPHFNEGFFNVREWDYVFNYRQNGEHKTCQFKVLFDNHMNAQSFFWKPAGCDNRFELSADLLFGFDEASLTEAGKEKLDSIIKSLKTQDTGRVNIAGYTDRLGSDFYNQALSQKRADAVKAYLIQQGFEADSVVAAGYGKADQVAACEAEQGEMLKACLQPNRRVVISASHE
ncbi:OmpA family protein [Uruburuella testudinis]|uniref:OmpA family protein n=1 Tax=Uruburuella testudinis TaxID=1282863 RepID=A0ABY4DQX9_9NEIS|nr:OmpA family protein [Uruburuella testudinis]UOO81453.1 OmpA family protein [Uruburuella testudinis]